MGHMATCAGGGTPRLNFLRASSTGVTSADADGASLPPRASSTVAASGGCVVKDRFSFFVFFFFVGLSVWTASVAAASSICVASRLFFFGLLASDLPPQQPVGIRKVAQCDARKS